MSPFALTTDIGAYFREAVEAAIKARRVEIASPTQAYLVGILEEQAKPGTEQPGQPFTLLFEAALEAPTLSDRFERLRVLGDGLLYRLGFFGDHFEARGVDADYLIALGSRAYQTAGSMLAGASTRALDAATNTSVAELDVFGELARKFGTMVGVLNEVADATTAANASSQAGVVRLYERWLRTGSDSLAEALQSHGLTQPKRGQGGPAS